MNFYNNLYTMYLYNNYNQHYIATGITIHKSMHHHTIKNNALSNPCGIHCNYYKLLLIAWLINLLVYLLFKWNSEYTIIN